MRVNVYAEEQTGQVEIISKEIDGTKFTGVRFYLQLPATVGGVQYQGPFIHKPGDDDSSAVTFWGKRDLRSVLRTALELLDAHYAGELKQEGLRADRKIGDVFLVRGRFSGDVFKVKYESPLLVRDMRTGVGLHPALHIVDDVAATEVEK